MGYDRDVLINVVPLTVYGPMGKFETFGVLDECAERDHDTSTDGKGAGNMWPG